MENVQRILPWIRFLWNNENRCFHLESNMSLLYIKTTDNQWSFHASSGKGKCKLISPFSLLMSYIHSWKRCRKKTEWRITNLRKSFWKFGFSLTNTSLTTCHEFIRDPIQISEISGKAPSWLQQVWVNKSAITNALFFLLSVKSLFK